jgi:hypothetical protein
VNAGILLGALALVILGAGEHAGRGDPGDAEDERDHERENAALHRILPCASSSG